MKTKAQKAKETEQAEQTEQTETVEAIVTEKENAIENAVETEKKELTPSEVVESLEAEAADRKPAPEVSIDYDYMQGLKARTEIPKMLDKSDPTAVHVWQPDGIEASTLKAKRLTVVMKDGEPVRDGGDILCKLPRELFDRKREQERTQSEANIAGIVPKGQEHKFKRKRTPKSPSGEEG